MTMASSSMNMLMLPQLRCALAPELRQSLTLLQMTSVDLFSYLREVEQDNPLIQLEDVEWLSYESKQRRGVGYRTDGADIAAFRTERETLEQTLLTQIRLTDAPLEVKRAAAFLAGSLDESGYLDIGLNEAAACMGLVIGVVEAGLRLLHTLEPAGIAATSLKECLLLQASRDTCAPTFVEELIQRHLGDIAKGRFKVIAKSLRICEQEIEYAVRYLRGLHHRPGLRYGHSDVSYAIAEIKLRRTACGIGFAVRDTAPFRVSYHASALDTRVGSLEWRAWVAAKRKEAAALDGMLRFRKSTLIEITAAIAVQQHRFMDEGTAAIRPLKLEQIAAETGFHLSTVSRAVRGKYVDTPFGVLPIPLFFSSGLICGSGEEVSSRAVKHRIRGLIAGENKRRPFTDARLAALLHEEGVSISRRTVAKYREEERIPPSTYRAMTQ
ncbi:RNA polymerase factor sigma-54 [Paenibacillus sinopodophylli]|uniref:RNA polymerase factor sigma-54 n=1 Tax=Paenibacillus sinopodophylli TaxID=1837342 RepID=UPI00110CDF78|nr:RNA polymerase factor sigma-54 [Paenibacillus sinopodophylli]